MQSGKIHRINPYNQQNSRMRTQTVTETGLLHEAIMKRRRSEIMKRYRRMKFSKLRRMFTRDFDKTLQKFTGQTLAKMVYGLWRKGYFSKYDEFADRETAKSAGVRFLILRRSPRFSELGFFCRRVFGKRKILKGKFSVLHLKLIRPRGVVFFKKTAYLSDRFSPLPYR